MQRESLTAQHTQGNHKNEQGVSKCDSLSGNAVIVYQEGVDVCMVCVAHLMLRNIRISFSLWNTVEKPRDNYTGERDL